MDKSAKMTCCARRSMKWHDCLCHTQLSNGLQHYRKRLGSSDIGFGHVPMGRFTYQGLLEDYTGVYTPSGRVLSALQTDHRDLCAAPHFPNPGTISGMGVPGNHNELSCLPLAPIAHMLKIYFHMLKIYLNIASFLH